MVLFVHVNKLLKTRQTSEDKGLAILQFQYSILHEDDNVNKSFATT